MFKSIGIFISCVFILSIGCSKDGNAVLQEETIFEVSYGADPLQKLDIYLPEGRTEQTKLLIFIHGGNWNAGDKSDYAIVLSDLHNQGFAIANLDYRLADASSGILYSDLSDDIHSAIEFLKTKSSTFIYSPDKIIISGHSAGGHLALYTAYANNDDNSIKAVMSLAGPTDVTDAYFTGNPDLNALVENLTGIAYLADTAIWVDASPISHVTAASPPTLLLYCGLDFVVPASQGSILNGILDAAAVENQFINYPLYGHDMGTIYFGGHLPEEVKTDMLNFVQNHAN